MTAEELQVIITAKTEGLRREMDGVKKRMDAMEKQSNGVQSKMSSMFSGIKKAMVAAGLAVGIQKITSEIKDLTKEALGVDAQIANLSRTMGTGKAAFMSWAKTGAAAWIPWCCITRKTWTPLPGSACSWQTDFAFLLQLDGDFLPFSMRYWRKGRDFYDILCNQTDKAPCVRGEVEAAAPCGRAALVGRSPISSQPACLAPFSGR